MRLLLHSTVMILRLHLKHTSTMVEFLSELIRFKIWCDFGNFTLYQYFADSKMISTLPRSLCKLVDGSCSLSRLLGSLITQLLVFHYGFPRRIKVRDTIIASIDVIKHLFKHFVYTDILCIFVQNIIFDYENFLT